MADPRKLVRENVPGEFFVDTTCIDCDTCRQLAPQVFGETDKFSFVAAQPQRDPDVHDALRALVCCPTGSIGTRHANRAKSVLTDFPLHIEGDVFYCGFNSPKSFGGNSYFIRRAEGNWLIDSPKFLPHLVRRAEEWGGIGYIFLTHRDDIADAARYAKRFGSRRIIHREELSAQPAAEIVIDGLEPREILPGFRIIPTPGHTEGHLCLLYQDRYLFTGDHLWWNRGKQRLGASLDYCWHSWDRQTESMARLSEFSFEWVLPGHGQRIRLPAVAMRRELNRLVERMHAVA